MTSVDWRDGRAHVVLAAVGYDALIVALEALQRDARLRAVEATITARVEPGISARRAHARPLTAPDDGPATARGCPGRGGCARGDRRSRMARARGASRFRASRVPPATPCASAAAEGTVWRGRGTHRRGDGANPIAWDVDFRPLLQGTVRVQVRSVTAPRRRAQRSHFTGMQSRCTTSTSRFRPPSSRPSSGYAASVAGEVGAIADDFELAPGSYRGEARLVWRGARIDGIGDVGPLDLGEVRSTVKADGNAISGPLANEGGDLALRGRWTMNAKDGLALALLLTPARADQAELTRTLSAIGTAEAEAGASTGARRCDEPQASTRAVPCPQRGARPAGR